MKKFNMFALAVAVLASVILLVAWFALGFNRVDAPIDLTLTVMWWLLIAGVACGIVRAEQLRRESIRTVYVGENEMFNPECGSSRRPADAHELVRATEETLRSLKYGFSLHELPHKGERPRFTHVIRTFSYDPENGEWDGEVVFAEAAGCRPYRFESRAQLAFALAS